MARLVYSAIASLDGYVNDVDGRFDWAAPDEQVHAYVNELERGIGTHLYGRRMYEVMRYWADPDPEADQSPAMRDYREIWQAADKVVYSRTLSSVTTPRTRLESSFDAEAIGRLVTSASSDVSVGGPHLGAAALSAGLVDDVHLVLVPVVVGGGTRALPDGFKARLELAVEHRFDGGAVHLGYRVRPWDTAALS